MNWKRVFENFTKQEIHCTYENFRKFENNCYGINLWTLFDGEIKTVRTDNNFVIQSTKLKNGKLVRLETLMINEREVVSFFNYENLIYDVFDRLEIIKI